MFPVKDPLETGESIKGIYCWYLGVPDQQLQASKRDTTYRYRPILIHIVGICYAKLSFFFEGTIRYYIKWEEFGYMQFIFHIPKTLLMNFLCFVPAKGFSKKMSACWNTGFAIGASCALLETKHVRSNAEPSEPKRSADLKFGGVSIWNSIPVNRHIRDIPLIDIYIYIYVYIHIIWVS